MIIPEYHSANEQRLIVFYCVYFEVLNHVRFTRYLTPNGWARGTYYFPSLKEAQDTFQQFNQAPLPVTERELADYIQEERDFNEHYWKSLEKELENRQWERMAERQQERQMERMYQPY